MFLLFEISPVGGKAGTVVRAQIRPPCANDAGGYGETEAAAPYWDVISRPERSKRCFRFVLAICPDRRLQPRTRARCPAPRLGG